MSNEQSTPASSQSDNLAGMYSRMRPDQRMAIAEQFIREFRLSHDPQAQRFVGEVGEDVPAGQVLEMHQFAQQNAPEAFARVMDHPVTRAAFAHAGEHLVPEAEATSEPAPYVEETSPALERAEQAEDVIGALDPGSNAKRNPDEPDEFDIFLHR